MMRSVALGLFVIAGTSLASAQDAALPDLKGVWSGPFRTVIYGHNPHHPGAETTADAPRVRDIVFTIEFEGQDGRLVWGHSWSDPARKEPFAGTIALDGKRVDAVDLDGAFTFDVASPDRLDTCYSNTALGPAQAIVASCGYFERTK